MVIHPWKNRGDTEAWESSPGDADGIAILAGNHLHGTVDELEVQTGHGASED